jgi:putative transposase
MPRTARAAVGGVCYHVLNRGNARARVFLDQGDYAAFVDLLGRAHERLPMRVLAFSLMPNHFHLVLWPHDDGDLGRWMHWLLTSHVRRHPRRWRGSGHVWQGRFKAFPIQEDPHLLAVLRYVERNPVRAGLAARAEAWPWSSARQWGRRDRAEWLAEGPTPRPSRGLSWINQPQAESELEALRQCLHRGRPWGEAAWVDRTASRLGLDFTLRPRGRPRKGQKSSMSPFSFSPFSLAE